MKITEERRKDIQDCLGVSNLLDAELEKCLTDEEFNALSGSDADFYKAMPQIVASVQRSMSMGNQRMYGYSLIAHDFLDNVPLTAESVQNYLEISPLGATLLALDDTQFLDYVRNNFQELCAMVREVAGIPPKASKKESWADVVGFTQLEVDAYIQWPGCDTDAVQSYRNGDASALVAELEDIRSKVPPVGERSISDEAYDWIMSCPMADFMAISRKQINYFLNHPEAHTGPDAVEEEILRWAICWYDEVIDDLQDMEEVFFDVLGYWEANHLFVGV